MILLAPATRKHYRRAWDAVLLFGAKLLLATGLALSDMFMKWLCERTIGAGLALAVLEAILDIVFVGTATVVAFSGAILVAHEVWHSTRAHMTQKE